MMPLQTGTDIQHFCYDEQNRLIVASANGTASCGAFTAGTLTSAQYQQSYTYDTNGRLTTGSQGSYSYGSSSHLHAVTSTSNGYSAAYDAAGNMTCRAPSSTTTCSGTQTGQQLSYDLEGNLSTWQNQPSPTSTVNYLYDGDGIRVAQQVSSGSNTTLTSYIGQLETVITGSSTSTTTYYSTGGLRIAEAVNGTFSYLGNDVLGSTAVALNALGQLAAAQLYGAYGNVRYNSGTMPTDIGFTGQRGDSATGLSYYGARYYDPAVGQFISADIVLPGNGFNPWGLSRYAYVMGNPETMTDPTGQRFISSDGTQVGQIGTLVSPNNPRPPSLPPRRPSNRGNGGKNPGTGGKKVTQADATHMLFDLCMSSSDCTNHYLWEKAKYAAMQIDPSEVYTKAQQTRSQAAGAFFNADVAKKAIVDAVTNGVGTYQVNRDTGVTEATFKVSLTEDVGYMVAKNAKGQWEYYDTGNVTVVLSQNSQGLWYLKTAYPTP